MPQGESCRLITGRRVPANPLEVRTSPIVIDSSQSRPYTQDYLRKLFTHPRSKVRALRRLESVSAVQPHDQKTIDLSVVIEVSGLRDLSIFPSIGRQLILSQAFIGGAGHRRCASAGAPARAAKIRGDHRRPVLPSCRPDSFRPDHLAYHDRNTPASAQGAAAGMPYCAIGAVTRVAHLKRAAPTWFICSEPTLLGSR